MAAPTVHFNRIPSGSNASLLSAFMPMLQGLLFDAGWDILYADSDAIGGGSSSVPAWDKAPASSQTAGRAIYRMPANDHSRQWYVQIQPGWETNASLLNFRVTIGTGWDSVDALTGAGNELFYRTSASGVSNESIAAATEDGFTFQYASSSTSSFQFLVVERARAFDGTVGDDLIVLGYAITGTFFDGSPAHSGVRYRASDGLEHNSARWLTLAPINNPTTWSTPQNFTTTSSDGETNVPIGPLANSGELSGLPRLAIIVGPNDAVLGTDHPVLVDGGVKQYWTATSAPNNAYVVLIARE